MCCMDDIEHKIQVSICQYLDLKNICYWAVPNGGRRNIGTARKLKAEGVKAGIPDLTVIHNGRYYGIEVKKPKTSTPKGRLSQSQLQAMAKINDSGGVVGLAYSVSDVIDLLEIWGIS